MRVRTVIVVVAALFCSACSMSGIGESTPPPDPRPGEQDMSKIYTDARAAFAKLNLSGYPEISDVHPNRGPFLSEWAMCMRNDASGKRQYYTFFFKDRKVSEYRLSVIVDGCETETYRRLPG